MCLDTTDQYSTYTQFACVTDVPIFQYILSMIKLRNPGTTRLEFMRHVECHVSRWKLRNSRTVKLDVTRPVECHVSHWKLWNSRTGLHVSSRMSCVALKNYGIRVRPDWISLVLGWRLPVWHYPDSVGKFSPYLMNVVTIYNLLAEISNYRFVGRKSFLQRRLVCKDACT